MALFLVHSAIESEKDTTVGREGGGGTPDFKWQGWSNGGQKSKPKKFLGSNIKPHKIPFQISEAKFGGIFFLENYAAATNLQNVLNTRKIPTYLNQSTQENTCQIFLPKKNSRIETFKSKRILWSSPSLEIRSNLPPLVYYSTWGTTMVTACSAAEARYFPCPFLSCSFFSVLLLGHTTEEACAASCLMWNWSVLLFLPLVKKTQ